MLKTEVTQKSLTSHGKCNRIGADNKCIVLGWGCTKGFIKGESLCRAIVIGNRAAFPIECPGSKLKHLTIIAVIVTRQIADSGEAANLWTGANGSIRSGKPSTFNAQERSGWDVQCDGVATNFYRLLHCC